MNGIDEPVGTFVIANVATGTRTLGVLVADYVSLVRCSNAR